MRMVKCGPLIISLIVLISLLSPLAGCSDDSDPAPVADTGPSTMPDTSGVTPGDQGTNPGLEDTGRPGEEDMGGPGEEDMGGGGEDVRRPAMDMANMPDVERPEGAPTVMTGEITNVTATSATVSGEVIDEGSSAVFTRGIVFGPIPNPTTDGATVSSGSGEGAFEAQITGLEVGMTYYVRAFAINQSGVAYGTQKTLASEYTVGGTGPAGGLVFYDKGSVSEGWRYLEAAPSGWNQGAGDADASWGCSGTSVGADGDGIGEGRANTNVVLGAECGGRAFRLSDGLEITVNGTVYDDWFLPSLGELDELYKNVAAMGMGGFESEYYLSSTEDNADSIKVQRMDNGIQSEGFKGIEFPFRPVRAF